MRFTIRLKSLFVAVYLLSFTIAAIGCTADQMAKTQTATKTVADTATTVATLPVPPNPATDWAAVIAAGAGSILLIEKVLAKYIVPTGIQTAKNVGTLPSNSTTVTAPIPTQPIVLPTPQPGTMETTTVTNKLA